MTLSAVAARYANALADVATRAGSELRAQDALTELRSFEDLLKTSSDLREALMTPAIPVGRKRAVIGRFADLLRLSRISRNFLFVLVDHRRIALLSEIIAAFELVVDERLGFARADVQSARELTGPQRDAVRTPAGAAHGQADSRPLRHRRCSDRRSGGAHRIYRFTMARCGASWNRWNAA